MKLQKIIVIQVTGFEMLTTNSQPSEPRLASSTLRVGINQKQETKKA